jgi:hypothetical protein
VLLEEKPMVVNRQMATIHPDPGSPILELLGLLMGMICPTQQIYLTPVIHLKV